MYRSQDIFKKPEFWAKFDLLSPIIKDQKFSKKFQAPDADPKATQQINSTGNLEQQATMFFIIEEAKETVLDFSQEL